MKRIKISIKKFTLRIFVCSSLLGLSANAYSQVYLDVNAPIEDRVEDALKRMTLDEKIAIIHAQSKFSSPGVPRLGIPENWTTDGPHGIRAEVLWDEWYGAEWTNDSCIAFPALTCLAATWNETMSAMYGKVIGEEARYRNKNILLGPGVNIYRTPLNGRNFEYMGEDPYLASRMVVPYIKAVQTNGVAACVKHFALNNQEVNRSKINVKVSDRALHEIYLPAFKAAVCEAGAWAIMGAYNKYNDEFCCHNDVLLNKILKEDWKFDGVVVSDWGGTHDTKQAIKNGLDMEFGSWTNGMNWGASNAYDSYYLAEPYKQLIKKGEFSTKELDDKCRRVLRLIFRTNMAKTRHFGSFGTEKHALAGRKIATEGMVLLKNDKSVLPIDDNSIKNILVVGENAIKPMTVGGGSSSLKAKYEVSPLKGIMNRFSGKCEVKFCLGYKSPAQKEQDKRDAVEPKPEVINYDSLRIDAVNAAKVADVVIFVGGLNKNNNQDCEGRDRLSLDLPYFQDKLISELSKVNDRIAVVLVSGNAVAMPWKDDVPAILQAWYSGTEAGNALADILSGDVNPSGKLPFTFPESLSDNGAHALGEYPGDGKNVNYTEGIMVGYRYSDHNKKAKDLFCFGHGLSYTKFKYGKMTVSDKKIHKDGTLSVFIPVTNVGNVDGAEIVQLYIRDKKASVERPYKELKGFKKLNIPVGETVMAEFKIDSDALSYYDETKGWVVEPGKFEIHIGASVSDIRDIKEFELID